jgi:hypothetical protein
MNSQKGSAHVIIITVLVAALIGALGFVFWQNFINKSPADSNVKTGVAAKQKTQATATYQTFTLDALGISFQYPQGWTVTTKFDGSATDEYGNKLLEVDVADEQGAKVAALQNPTGLGGMCDPSDTNTYETLEAVKTDLDTPEPVAVALTAMKAEDGSYGVHYGLTDAYATTGSGEGCFNVFYYAFDPGDKFPLGRGLAFGNDITATARFANIQQVKTFMASEKYENIKRMVRSLKY